MERRVPTKEEVLAYLTKDRNWGRWGDDDQIGAVNMVIPEKRAAAPGWSKQAEQCHYAANFLKPRRETTPPRPRIT